MCKKSDVLSFLGKFFAQWSRTDVLRATFGVLRLEIVEFIDRNDLNDGQSLWVLCSEHANRVFISLDHRFDQRLVIDLKDVLKSRLDLFTAIAEVYAKRASFSCRFDNARAAELSLDVFCLHLVGRMEQDRSRGRHSYLLIDDLRFGLINRSCARPNTRTRVGDTKNLEHPLDRTVFTKFSMKCQKCHVEVL